MTECEGMQIAESGHLYFGRVELARGSRLRPSCVYATQPRSSSRFASSEQPHLSPILRGRLSVLIEPAGCMASTFEADALCISSESGPTCLTRQVPRQ